MGNKGKELVWEYMDWDDWFNKFHCLSITKGKPLVFSNLFAFIGRSSSTRWFCRVFRNIAVDFGFISFEFLCFKLLKFNCYKSYPIKRLIKIVNLIWAKQISKQESSFESCFSFYFTFNRAFFPCVVTIYY